MPKPLTEVKMDSSQVTVHSISEQKMEKYRKAPEFNYFEKSPEGNSFWQFLFHKLQNTIGKVLSSRISGIVFYIVFIGIFILLLIVLFGADLQGIMVRSKNNQLNIPVITDENIENSDFDKIIRNEIDNGNYNRAVRYLYLKLLQVLTGQSLIVWQKEKTNRDYFRELLNTNYSVDFRSITSAYEYVWYGKFPLERSNFEGIYKSFNDFFERLNA